MNNFSDNAIFFRQSLFAFCSKRYNLFAKKKERARFYARYFVVRLTIYRATYVAKVRGQASQRFNVFRR